MVLEIVKTYLGALMFVLSAHFQNITLTVSVLTMLIKVNAVLQIILIILSRNENRLKNYQTTV
jgi:hypothetical protein